MHQHSSYRQPLSYAAVPCFSAAGVGEPRCVWFVVKLEGNGLGTSCERHVTSLFPALA